MNKKTIERELEIKHEYKLFCKSCDKFQKWTEVGIHPNNCGTFLSGGACPKSKEILEYYNLLREGEPTTVYKITKSKTKVDYGSHELLDRIYVIKTNLEEMVKDHHRIVEYPETLTDVEDALDTLEKAYQELGQKIL